jgi:hypothetical protein
MKNHEATFDRLFKIMSSPQFLAMEGLGKEVPYFIQAYDIEDQAVVYRKIDALIKRLELEGIPIVSFGLYDFVIGYFQKSGDLEELFAQEPTVEKSSLLEEMSNMLSPESVVVPEIVRRVEESSAKVLIIHQAGEVFPYIRAHEILTNLQSSLSDRPVILFFPGDYITSYEEGFKLKLFGKLEARYYRAFKLEDYIIRGNIHADAQGHSQ